MNIFTWIIFGWLSLLNFTHAASFDCAKATTKIENLICSNAELSKLDEDLNSAYQKSLLRNDVKQNAITSQKQWLKNERNVCQSVECIKLAYETRIKELGLTSSFGIVFLRPTNSSTSTPSISSVSPVPKTAGQFEKTLNTQSAQKKDVTETTLSSNSSGPIDSKEISKSMDLNTLPWKYDFVGQYTSKIVRSVFVNELRHLAFVVVDVTAVTILDISDLHDVKQIAKIDLAVSPKEVLSNQAGTVLYIASDCLHTNTGCNGLQIVDIRDPTHPVLINSPDTISSVGHISLSKDESKLIVLDSTTNVINIFEAHSGGVTKLLGQLKLENSDPLNGQIQSFSLSKNDRHLYFAVNGKGLSIADISDPRHVKILSFFQPWDNWFGDFVVTENDQIAIFTTHRNDLIIGVDVSNPMSPRKQFELNATGVDLSSVPYKSVRLFDNGKRLLLAFRSANWLHNPGGGLAVLDIANPHNPKLIGVVETPVSIIDFSQFYVSADEKYIFISSNDRSKKGKMNAGQLNIFQRH